MRGLLAPAPVRTAALIAATATAQAASEVRSPCCRATSNIANTMHSWTGPYAYPITRYSATATTTSTGTGARGRHASGAADSSISPTAAASRPRVSGWNFAASSVPPTTTTGPSPATSRSVLGGSSARNRPAFAA
jgi:hypothetical protein